MEHLLDITKNTKTVGVAICTPFYKQLARKQLTSPQK